MKNLFFLNLDGKIPIVGGVLPPLVAYIYGNHHLIFPYSLPVHINPSENTDTWDNYLYSYVLFLIEF